MLQICHRILGALALSCALVAQARADDLDLCIDSAANPDASIPACTRLLDKGGSVEEASELYNQRGVAKEGKGDLDGASRDFTAALDRNPNLTVALKNRGFVRKKLGEADLAVADFSRALRLAQNGPLAADLYNLRGATLIDKDEYDAAIADFNRSIMVDRKYVKAYVNRGQAYYFKRDFDKAIADFDQAVRLLPDDPFGYSNRAMARMEKADFKGAIADYDRAIRLDPRNPTWHSRRGEAWRLQGDLDRSLADHDRALSLKPNEEAYNNRALTLKDMGKLSDAQNDCSEAILLNPSYDLAYANRGLVRRLAGDLRGALRDLDKAIGLAQRSTAALTYRGDAYRELGDIGRALQDYDEAIRILPDYIAAHAGRGLALEKKGDRAGAKAAFQRAASLSSDADAGVAKPAQKIAKERLAAIRVEEGEADPGVRVALVVGNSAYRAVPALPNPQKDADAVAKALEGLGFKTVIKVYNASNVDFLAALKTFEEKAAQADWGVIFYAGHGFQIAGGNYLIPVDAQLRTDQDVQKEAVPLERVLQAANKAKKLRLVLLDACRDNPFEPKMKRVITTHVVTQGLSSIEPRGGTLVAYATRDGHTAEDGDGDHSPFTQALLDNMAKHGVEINMLFRQVRDQVLKLTQGRQDPFTYGSLTSERFYFVAR
ncbi:tetratricopeptide repeat protein [Methylosinus sp. Sm6]|uniref:tetratricopeptide repeat protein n=1 Tax=Methylosinus sp. Sm6 TaxID=2866948 RepID=UPI0021084E85|nr:tetratricopeptide repeat protein [Methylosinus sp. Sm6]